MDNGFKKVYYFQHDVYGAAILIYWPNLKDVYRLCVSWKHYFNNIFLPKRKPKYFDVRYFTISCQKLSLTGIIYLFILFISV